MQHTIKGIKPHVIHSHHPHLLGDLAARYAEDLNVPLIFTVHARFDEFVRHQVPLFGDLASQVARGVVQEHLDHCSQIIVPTASIQQLVHEDYKVDVPVTILPTPIDLTRLGDLNPARIRRRYHLEGQQVLLYVGRMSPEKGLEFLIDSFALVTARNPRTLLVLVGRGPHIKSVQDHVQSLRIQDRIIFTGAAPHDQVPHFMAAADLFVFPSRAETQGLVLIEAMATGLPVVALHGTGSDDVLADTGAGVLSLPDEAAFADAILTTLADPDQLAAMGQAARQVAQCYSVAALTEQLLGVYERALLSGPHHR
jgi:1,2-diacylglycerol 3-alpha-glucosyltransferase